LLDQARADVDWQIIWSVVRPKRTLSSTSPSIKQTKNPAGRTVAGLIVDFRLLLCGFLTAVAPVAYTSKTDPQKH